MITLKYADGTSPADRIYAAMDGQEWNADLWDVVAAHLIDAGYPPFRSPDEFLNPPAMLVEPYEDDE